MKYIYYAAIFAACALTLSACAEKKTVVTPAPIVPAPAPAPVPPPPPAPAPTPAPAQQ